MLTIVQRGSAEERARLKAIESRRAEAGAEVTEAVTRIAGAVREQGWDAAVRYSIELDHAEPRELTSDELDAAVSRCDAALLDDLRTAAASIRDYQQRLVPESHSWRSPSGATVGQRVTPLARVGVYVPGGTAAYPSSVLMTVVPAKAAGVPEVVMVTPPTAFMKDEVLAAARIAGVDRVFALGGIQAVASLAYGAGPVPRVDKLVGPGNAFVTEAKRMLFGCFDIDMTAGPSEVLILADETARPDWVAADLLSQAEHDKLAAAYLVTASAELAERVAAELQAQCAALPRHAIAAASLERFGTAFICADMDECIACANAMAPEHLELMVSEAASYIPRIHAAGAIFVGAWTPEPLGDYIAGPSHVLPTSGTARFFSPLSADSFVKRTSVIEYDQASFAAHSAPAARLARCEELEGHARSLERRGSI